MSSRTTNLNLVKPSSDENVSLPVINGNYDTLDTEVAARVKTADIQNNLTSTATNKPLSAAQGKALSDTKADKSVTGSNYTKMDDGTLIVTGYVGVQLTASSWTSFGSWYYTRINVNATFPVQFVGMPVVNAVAYFPDASISAVHQTIRGIEYIDLVRPTTVATLTEVYWCAIGKWK